MRNHSRELVRRLREYIIRRVRKRQIDKVTFIRHFARSLKRMSRNYSILLKGMNKNVFD